MAQDTETPKAVRIRKRGSWLNAFINEEQNSFFCRVDDSFLSDRFELFELDRMVKNYDYVLNLIRNRKLDEIEQLTKEQQETVGNEAEILYGLIHSRFIITKHGLHKMREKYINQDFGICHRHYCHQQALLPVGITDRKNKEFIRLYCPHCEDIYLPQKECHKTIDGAYFGTTFAHLFMLTFPRFKKAQKMSSIHDNKQYIQTIFGYKLHKTWHKVALQAFDRKYNKRNNNMNNIEEKDEEETIINKGSTESIDQKQLIYLQQLKEKQNGEIMRLGDIIKKQEKQINHANKLNKDQGIQLLLTKTKMDIMQQQMKENDVNSISNGINKAPMPNAIKAPIPKTMPAPLPKQHDNDEEKELKQDVGFKDILETLKQRINAMKNKYEESKIMELNHDTNDKNVELYDNELDEICKLCDSFKVYLNPLQNGT